MPNYEEQVRRDLEQAAKEQQAAPPVCPVEEDIDAALTMSTTVARKLATGKSTGQLRREKFEAKKAAAKRSTTKQRASSFRK